MMLLIHKTQPIPFVAGTLFSDFLHLNKLNPFTFIGSNFDARYLKTKRKKNAHSPLLYSLT